MYAISISATTLGFATSYVLYSIEKLFLTFRYFPEYMKATLAGGIIFSMLKEQSSINNLSSDGKKEVGLSNAVVL